MYLKNCFLIVLFSCLFGIGMSGQIFFSEDFDGGIPESWTNLEVEGNGQPSSVWMHTYDGPAAWWSGPALASTTADNGWVIFDSDLNGQIGNAQNAWLISPEIDGTDKESVYLVFESVYRRYDDRPQIRVGLDLNDLENWASIELWPEVGLWDYVGELEPVLEHVNLTEFAANRVFRFAFQFLSDETTDNGGGSMGYNFAWQLDDVFLYRQTENNLAIANDFWSISPSAITPVSQVIPFGFIYNIENLGTGTVESSTMEVSISNSSGEVFSTSDQYGSLSSGQQLDNYIFEEQFIAQGDPDEYVATYIITPDNGPDELFYDNTATFNFKTSDTLFSKDLEYTRIVYPADYNNYSYACIYYAPNGSDWYARYVSFGVGNAYALTGKSCNILLYEWEGDSNQDGLINPSEMTGEGAIATNNYQFIGDESYQIITVPIDNAGEGVALADGKYYVIAIQYAAEADEDMALLASEEFDYSGTVFLTDSLNKIDNNFPVQYPSALDVDNTGEYLIIGFGNDIVPMIRLSIGDNGDLSGPAIVGVGIEKAILPEGAASVYPNPVDKVANVEINLNSMSENITIDIFNMTGKLVSRTKYQNVQNQTVKVVVANLPAGNYKMKIQTDTGVKTTDITIQR